MEANSTSATRPARTPQAQLLGLVGFAAATVAAAALGGVAAGSSGEDYQQLRRPSWAPPSWLFGPVWTALYVLIAVAGWLVWRALGWRGARRELTLYAAQLVLNAAWTPLFFLARRYGLAFAEIVALDVVLLATVVTFWRRHRLAGALLVPYLCWALFATALNLAIWRFNR